MIFCKLDIKSNTFHPTVGFHKYQGNSITAYPTDWWSQERQVFSLAQEVLRLPSGPKKITPSKPLCPGHSLAYFWVGGCGMPT